MRAGLRWLLAVAIVAVALVVHLAAPGPSSVVAPYQAIGAGAASVGDVAVTVHDVTLADAIVVDGTTVETNGVFVVVDATYAVSGVARGIACELVVGQSVHSASARGPSDFEAGQPSVGFPVRGDAVFEIDRALLGTPGAVLAQLRVAHGFTASGDLGSQAVAIVAMPASVEQVVAVSGLELEP